MDEEKQAKRKAFIILCVITAIMVLMKSIDNVLYIRMAKKMDNYAYFLSSIVLSVGYAIIVWPIAWYQILTGKVSTKSRNFSQAKFFLMGSLDTLSNLLGTIPVAYVSGPIAVISSQTIIPVTMLFSFFLLKTRYSWTHYVAVLIVLGGIIVDVIPLFQKSLTISTPWFWFLLLESSYIPFGLNNIAREYWLKSEDMNIWYMNAWNAFYQVVFGIILMPIILIPLPPPATHLSPKDFWKFMWDSIKCLGGINTLDGDLCHDFYFVLIIFFVFNVSYGTLMLVVFKKGSSTMAMVASAARLALSNIGFLIPFLAGEATSKRLTKYDIIALVVLIVGIIIYQIKPELKKTPEYQSIPSEEETPKEQHVVN